MKVIIILIHVLGGLTLLPWFAAAGRAFMVFESPNSIKKVQPWLFVMLVFAYPFILGSSFWEAWNCVDEGEILDPMVWSSIPTFVFLLTYMYVTRLSNLHKKMTR
jgi:hypothetical protein